MNRWIAFIIPFGLSSFTYAQELQFYDFSDLSSIQLNGTAANLNPNNDNVLRLTDDLYQSSSAFLTDSISLDNFASFSAAFEFQISDPQGIYDSDGQGADGLAFVLQSNSNAVGGLGGDIGYRGINNSLAIEFDTWGNNWWDRSQGNHVGINIDGNMSSVERTFVDERMNNAAVWTVWIDYDGVEETIEVSLSQDEVRPDESILTANVNLANILGTTEAFVGFTSGTGAAGGDHDILSFFFNDDYDPITTVVINEPNSLALYIIAIFLVTFSRKMLN